MIEFKNLTLYYDRKKTPAIRNLTGRVAKGTLTAVTGPNGGGKTTLLKTMAGLLGPRSGMQIDSNLRAHEIGYLSQSPEFDLQFPLSVRDFVSLGRLPERGLFRALGELDHRQIDQSLHTVGLSDLAQEPLDSLSGGQLQRARFARLAAQQAKLLLLDEPLSAVDAETGKDLIAVIRDWHRSGLTIVIVLHETSLVREICPETLLMATEPIAWGATEEVLTPENRRRAHAVTAGLPHSRQWHEVST